jgi:redox-sensing transcriptional repressor
MHGITGNKKAGYDIESLLVVLNQLFEMDEIHNVILVGMGNVGRALANYNNQFIGQNVFIISAFDNDPAKHNKKSGVPVYSMQKLDEQIKKHSISAALLTVPGQAAQEVCDLLLDYGIRGIINFTNTILKTPDNVVINNINLGIEVEALIYYLNQQNQDK